MINNNELNSVRGDSSYRGSNRSVDIGDYSVSVLYLTRIVKCERSAILKINLMHHLYNCRSQKRYTRT